MSRLPLEMSLSERCSPSRRCQPVTSHHSVRSTFSAFERLQRIGSSLQSYHHCNCILNVLSLRSTSATLYKRHSRGMDFNFPIFLYFLLLFPTSSLACISVVKKTKADAVNAIANTLTNAAGIVLSSIPKVNYFSSSLNLDIMVSVLRSGTRNAFEKV